MNTKTRTLFGDIVTGAEFSPCRTWRYALWRLWGDGGAVGFVGLNPSTADETDDDPTIRRCVRFAKDWGYGGIYMLNLFALRSTDPFVLQQASDPVGPQNDELLAYYSTKCGLMVAAWGIHGELFGRDQEIRGVVFRRFDCLGLTKDGHPRHPLYVRADKEREQYWSPKE